MLLTMPLTMLMPHQCTNTHMPLMTPILQLVLMVAIVVLWTLAILKIEMGITLKVNTMFSFLMVEFKQLSTTLMGNMGVMSLMCHTLDMPLPMLLLPIMPLLLTMLHQNLTMDILLLIILSRLTLCFKKVCFLFQNLTKKEVLSNNSSSAIVFDQLMLLTPLLQNFIGT